MIAETPSAWPDVQSAFHEAYNRDPLPWERVRVHFRRVDGNKVWWGAGLWSVVLPLAWLASRVGSRRMLNESPVLALWPFDAPLGAPAQVIFDFDGSSVQEEGEAVLVGEMAANAALCLEVGAGVVVWPTYNPRAPQQAAPRR